MQIERQTVLPADVDQVRRALLRPELLTTWLGPWHEAADGVVTVTTDDGVTRRVSDHRIDDDGAVRWSWAPLSAPADVSHVVVHLEPAGPEHTSLAVRETREQPGVAARLSADPIGRATGEGDSLASSGERWTACLLALGAVLSARQLAAV